MRIIKFRAWDKHFKEMASIICLNIGQFSEDHILKSKSHPYTYNQKFENVILMQFTGLHDKNGREIYDGDVVLTGKYEDKKDDIFVVRWAHCGFVFDPIDEELDLEEIIFHEKSEIIGNIHENPELVQP